MRKQPHRATVSHPSSAMPAGAFALFMAGFVTVYALTSLALEYGVGIIGFAKAPYLNAVSYVYALGFVGTGLLLNRVRLGFFVPPPFALILVVCLSVAVVRGIANANAWQYIIGWTIYLVTAVLVFQFFRNLRHERDNADKAINGLFSLPFLLLALFLTGLSVFYKDNHYQYVLFEVIAIYAVLLRPRLIEKIIGLSIFALIHLGSNDGFVQVEINRASILAVGTVGLLYLLYRRHIVLLVFLIFAAIGGLLYAVSLDDTVVADLPRNIREAIMLMKGDDIRNHTSSYQRVYEGEKVMEDYDGATDAEWLFGMGLGRTIDMTGAADKTPGQHALLGATEVHNIHFLHFAIFHKFGLAGVTIITMLGASLAIMFVSDLISGRLDDIGMFFYIYLIYNFVFAIPASNFLIANPLWPAFLAALVVWRAGCSARERSESGAKAPLTTAAASAMRRRTAHAPLRTHQ